MKIAFEARDLKLLLFLGASIFFVALNGNFSNNNYDCGNYDYPEMEQTEVSYSYSIGEVDRSDFELISIERNQESTVIQMAIPSHSSFKLYPPGSPNSYFIMDTESGKRYHLVDAHNINYNEWTSGSRSFTLIFPALDLDVNEIHLVEGLNQTAMEGRPVNFFNLDLY
jgi:hypothetical protein